MNDLTSRFLVNVARGEDDLPPGFVVSGQQPKQTPYKGALIPMSVDENGNVSFDSNAGIFGGLKSAFTLPGDVMAGRARVPQSSAMPGGEGTENIGRVFELATTVSPVNPGITAGDQAIPGVLKATRSQKPVVPTTEEVAKAGAADLKAARASKLDVTSLSAADHSRKVQQEFFDDGISPVQAPKTFEKLKAVEDVPSDSVFTASNLQSLRESFEAIAKEATGAERDAAIQAIKRFDQFLLEIDGTSVLAGSPAATQKLFERGYRNRDAAQRSNGLTGELDRAATGISERAEARVQSAANPGRGLDETIASKANSLIDRSEISGLNTEEIAALNRVIEGGRARRASRIAGDYLAGSSPVQRALPAIGAGIGSLLGGTPGAVIGTAAPTGVGVIAKSIANMLARRDLDKAAKLMRMRSPVYEERVANPQISIMNPDALAARAAIAKALLLSASHREDKR